ncbi:MAG: thioredoxin [Oscillospiraceae bacterium]|nr:thioredoxin [Ruminococcus sp.]MCD8346041.1 thioredoxin [Oscillospiraceae bacterium]
MLTVLTNENFETEVLGSDKPVIIDFWAEWCGPCRMMSPVVDEIAEEHEEFKVCKCNVDEAPQLANKFQVTAIPTIVMIKNGELAATAVGYMPKEELLAELQK